VSNFRSVKDPARLARAFVEVRRQRSADLWLVGDGDEMPAVREILAGGEAIADVHLFGLRTDVERLYPKADVVVLTSRAESFSLVALEAAASAVPVVAPRVGGLPEVVLDGVTGLLYEHADPAEPARTLLRLLNDRDLHASMGAAAARHAQEFSHERGVEQYEDLYGELLDRRGRLEPAGVRATASGR
jgi:glycosyltransferase involved in cell wall biosynthesis